MAKDFISKADPKIALVVDSLNLGFRWKHAGKNQFTEEYINTVKSLARSYHCGKIIITADWGSSSYRKDLYSEYKQNRVDLRAEQTEKEKYDFELFIQEYDRTLRELESLGYPVLKYKRVEADDLAALIVKYRKELGIDQIWLISSDRDWDLLVSEEVSRFSYVTRKETTDFNWYDQYEFPLEDYITFKCLTGDKGDNIPGINGIGPKRAIKLMEEYGDVFDIYNSCPIPSHYKYIKELNANAEQLLLNVELMDLVTYSEQAIGEDNTSNALSKVKEYMND